MENEKHRHYHTLEHVHNVYWRIGEQNLLSLVFAITHDIVYNPRSKTNEEDSIAYITKDIKDELVPELFESLCEMIRDTKEIGKVTKYNRADREDVTGDLPQLLNYFELIRKEFDCYYYPEFIEGHISIIIKIREAHKSNIDVTNLYIDHVRKYKPSLAIYTGSFNPFHIGHYNVMIEAEKMFDKVIIAKGFNPDKTTQHNTNSDKIVTWDDVPSALWCKETVIYMGTIFHLYEHYSKLYDKVVFIKGFRSGHDIEYDLHQYRVIRGINPNINFTFIPCNSGMEHISSSMIRNLERLVLPTDRYLVK